MLGFILLLGILAMLYCLISGGYFLLVRQGNSEQLFRVLLWRVLVSVGIFVFILVAYCLGWIHPNVVMG